jgi:dynein heavy chain 1
MLKRFNRYPLIIDPSGQATEFIMNEYRDKKITKTKSILEIKMQAIYKYFKDKSSVKI